MNTNTSGAEVRVTADSGGAKGSKPARFDMIPTDSLWELAEQYGKGAGKYEMVNGLDNWRNGYPWSLSFAAAFRHLTLAMGGEDIDPETGQKHVIAVAWHMLALAHWMNNPDLVERYDDRQDRVERDVRAKAESPLPDFKEGDRVYVAVDLPFHADGTPFISRGGHYGRRATVAQGRPSDPGNVYIEYDGGGWDRMHPECLRPVRLT